MNRLMMVAVALLGACSVEVREDQEDQEHQEDSPAVAIYPIQSSSGSKQEQASVAPGPLAAEATFVCSSSIPYNGGPVMTNPINVYLIWYGNWSGNSAQTIIPNLLRSLGQSLRWQTDTTFTNGGGTPVSAALQLAGQFNDSYSQSSSLSFSAILQVVNHAISVGAFPSDSNGVYLVLTSADVSQSNSSTQTFCGSYCGWHTVSGSIKYGFIGNPDRCPASCTSGLLGSGSPNGNHGADGMASVIVHELDETATDPQLNAWFARLSNGNLCENADNCAWTFGGTWPTANGSTANVHIGAWDFLIQRNWANFGTGFCTTSWPGTCNGTPGQWSGCRGTGCSVCSELVSNAPCYFRNHPNCNANDTCGGQYFTCNANCPTPAGSDFTCQ